MIWLQSSTLPPLLPSMLTIAACSSHRLGLLCQRTPIKIIKRHSQLSFRFFTLLLFLEHAQMSIVSQVGNSVAPTGLICRCPDKALCKRPALGVEGGSSIGRVDGEHLDRKWHGGQDLESDLSLVLCEGAQDISCGAELPTLAHLTPEVFES